MTMNNVWGNSRKPVQAAKDDTLGTNANPINLDATPDPQEEDPVDEIPEPPEEDPEDYLQQRNRVQAAFRDVPPPPEVSTDRRQPDGGPRRRSARIQILQNEKRGLTAPDIVESPDKDEDDLWKVKRPKLNKIRILFEPFHPSSRER